LDNVALFIVQTTFIVRWYYKTTLFWTHESVLWGGLYRQMNKKHLKYIQRTRWSGQWNQVISRSI